MKAYSLDLRTRIVAAVDAGMSKAEAARRFDVGLSTVKRYLRLQLRHSLEISYLTTPVAHHKMLPSWNGRSKQWYLGEVSA